MRIKNNILLTRIERTGLSVFKFAKRYDLCYTTINALINYRRSPVSIRNISKIAALDGLYWTPLAIRLSEIFGKSVMEVFPEETWEKKKTNRYQIEVDTQDLIPYEEGMPFTEIEQPKDYSNLHKVLETLPPREKEILEGRYGLDGDGSKTLDELSEEYGVTKERIRQIESRAFRNIRNTIRLSALIDLHPAALEYIENKLKTINQEE